MAVKIQTHTFSIDKTIIHVIPKKIRGDDFQEPTFSENISEFSDGAKSIFRSKLEEALRSDKRLKAYFDSDSDSPVKFLAAQIITGDENSFIERSKSIANHLFETQKLNASQGILIVVSANLNGFKVCTIVKLEHDEGTELERDPIRNSFRMKQVENLMFTKKTKTHKVALILSREEFECDYDIILTDFQNDVRRKKNTTSKFMSDFIGCRPYDDPQNMTKNWYKHTIAFIDTLNDPELKVKYYQDVNSYTQSNRQFLNAREFANDYFSTSEQKDDYITHLESKGFPTSDFVKDTNLIKPSIEKITLYLENDISIIGKKGFFEEDRVTLEKIDDLSNKFRVIIESRIKKVE